MHRFYIFVAATAMAFLSLACNPNRETRQSKAVYGHQIVSEDSLIFRATDSIFISRTAQIASWNNKILISDFYQKRVWVFDKSFILTRSIGQKGKGPGEFINFPGIVASKDRLWLIDEGNYRVTAFDSLYRLISIHKLPAGYSLDRFPIYIKGKFVFDGHRTHLMHEPSDFKKYKPITILDTAFNVISEFWEWRSEYFSEELATKTFAQSNPHVLLARGAGESFFALQKASFWITHFDNDLREIREFGIKPRFFKEPPSIPYEQTAYSPEMISNYAGKTTMFLSLACDTTSGYVYLNYVNLHNDVFFQRTMLAGEHYIQVYDKNYDCILDEQIPGKLAFVEKNMIFVLAEEKPELIKLKTFTIMSNKE